MVEVVKRVGERGGGEGGGLLIGVSARNLSMAAVRGGRSGGDAVEAVGVGEGKLVLRDGRDLRKAGDGEKRP